MSNKPKRIPVCTHCNSDLVRADAWAEWDTDTQAWTLNNTFNDTYCEECDGPCKIKFIPFNDEAQGGQS